MGQNIPQVSYRGLIATREDSGGFGRADRMLEGHSDSGTGATGSAAADGIHYHQHGAVSRRKNAVYIGRRPGFLDAVLSQVCPHGGD